MRTFTAAVAALLLMAVPASAQVSPTVQAYSQPGGTIQQQINTPPQQQAAPGVAGSTAPDGRVSPAVSVQPTAQKGKLPFTGLELGLVLATGVGLLGLGLAVRRFARTPEAL